MTGILVNTTGLCSSPAIGLAVWCRGLFTSGSFLTHASLGETTPEGCLLIRYSEHVL